jgi:hypothetical protein
VTWLSSVAIPDRGRRARLVRPVAAGDERTPVERAEAGLADLARPADPPQDALAPDLSGVTIQSRARREEAVFVESTDSEYWLALCFHSRDDKADILTRCGLEPDDPDKHLDARDFLERLIDRIVALPEADRANRDALRRALIPDRPRELRQKTIVNSRWLQHIPRERR